jgi:hypothetical protein
MMSCLQTWLLALTNTGGPRCGVSEFHQFCTALDLQSAMAHAWRQLLSLVGRDMLFDIIRTSLAQLHAGLPVCW